MGASYLCIASKAEIDFNKSLGIASATFAIVIVGKHGVVIKEFFTEDGFKFEVMWSAKQKAKYYSFTQ